MSFNQFLGLNFERASRVAVNIAAEDDNHGRLLGRPLVDCVIVD